MTRDELVMALEATHKAWEDASDAWEAAEKARDATHAVWKDAYEARKVAYKALRDFDKEAAK